MAAPGSGNLEDHRFQRVRILDNVDDREIADNEGAHERHKGDPDEDDLPDCGRHAGCHEYPVACSCPQYWQDSLDTSQAQRQYKREVSYLRNHAVHSV